MQFLVHIAKKLVALHAAGWVHRDLKPANTIWLPSLNEWALIDLGCAGEVRVSTSRSAESDPIASRQLALPVAFDVGTRVAVVEDFLFR